MKSSLVVDLEIQEQGLQIGDRFFAYSQLRGFVMEADEKTKHPLNLILFTENNHHIYTFADTEEQIQEFVGDLLQRVAYLEDYQPSMLERLMKKLKI